MGRFDDRATSPRRGPADMLRWKLIGPLTGDRRREEPAFVAPRAKNDGAALREPAPSITWIGHATFVLKLAGRVVATDPIWSDRIAGTVPRRVAPGLRLEDLPKIDIVTVSHNHFDHLDVPTLKRIGPEPTYIVPLGVGPTLSAAGLPRVVELDWWQQHREGDLTLTLVPSRHWSMRMPWTRNESLWGGFVIQSPEGSAYHAGDTAFFEGFKEIGERLGPVDLALLPIGAYEPRWFMEPQHMCPEEAGEAFLALGAKKLVAMHWGTFKLTDEPLGEPPDRLRRWWKERGLPAEQLVILDIGETKKLG